MSTSYAYVASPGYTTVNRALSLETNVYDVRSEKMTYSGMSQTWTSDSRSAPIAHAAPWADSAWAPVFRDC